MTTTLHDAITEAIIANDYKAPASLRSYRRFIDGLVLRHPHLDRYKQQIAPLTAERFVAAAKEAEAEVEALFASMRANSIEGIESFTEAAAFECVRCGAATEIPVALLRRRGVPVCDVCHHRALLTRDDA